MNLGLTNYCKGYITLQENNGIIYKKCTHLDLSSGAQFEGDFRGEISPNIGPREKWESP